MDKFDLNALEHNGPCNDILSIVNACFKNNFYNETALPYQQHHLKLAF